MQSMTEPLTLLRFCFLLGCNKTLKYTTPISLFMPIFPISHAKVFKLFIQYNFTTWKLTSLNSDIGVVTLKWDVPEKNARDPNQNVTPVQ